MRSKFGEKKNEVCFVYLKEKLIYIFFVAWNDDPAQ